MSEIRSILDFHEGEDRITLSTKATRPTRTYYISQREAAEILGVHVATVRVMISDGRLTGYRLGRGNIRLRLADVEAALQPIPAAGA
jgi:excisionase family DNA binding protein